MVLLSVAIAIVAAYGGLRVFLARQDGVRLIFSAIAFGIAVSGMHYTAMDGMRFVPIEGGMTHHQMGGLAASQQILSLVVALLCFVVAAGFLLSLVPEPGRRGAATTAGDGDAVPVAEASPTMAGDSLADSVVPPEAVGLAAPRLRSAPLGGLGQPRAQPSPRLPVEGADGTHFIDTASIRSVRPMLIIPGWMTAPGSGCARGQFGSRGTARSQPVRAGSPRPHLAIPHVCSFAKRATAP